MQTINGGDEVREFFEKKEITCIVFVIIMFTFSILNFSRAYEPLKNVIEEEQFKAGSITLPNISLLINSLESEINKTIFHRFGFVEAFGYLQLLMGKHEQSNFETVKDTNGLLHFTYFADSPRNIKSLAASVNNLKRDIVGQDTELLYFMTPSKYIVGQTEFPTGMPYSFENETADEFLQILDENGVGTIDLRERILANGMLYDEVFFKSDHHWKIESSFWAFTELVDGLNKKYDVGIDEEGFYTNIDNYNLITYPNSYIGSMGRQTGKYYSGVDDFTIMYPKFRTNFEFSIGFDSLEENQFSGLFEDVFISSYILNRVSDPYNAQTDKYFSYLMGNQSIAHIKNLNNPEGLKVVFIKDSMVVPVISFFANVCSEIHFVDPRYYSGDIAEFINSLEGIDFVILSFYPQNMTQQFFPF